MLNFNPSFSFARRISRDISSAQISADERQPLLQPDIPEVSNEQVEHFVNPPQAESSDFKFLTEEWKHTLSIYANIHKIRREIILSIDDPYSYDQLRGNRLNKSVVRPLVDRFFDPKDISTVFCLMVNRVQFSREETTAKHQSISHSKSILCELVAIKILRRFSEEYHGPQGLLVLAHILVAGFDTFQNAPFEVAEEHSKAHKWLIQGKIESDRKLTALEIAIVSNSKNLLSTRPCQRVVDAIHQGTIVYTPTAFFEFLPDTYKYKDIGLYNPRKAPLLDQYRLVVPRNRYFLEIWHFIILLVLYIAQMEMRDKYNLTAFEVIFCIYTFGWLLDQVASITEHGWQVYTQNLWTYLDVSFGAAFLLYFILRLVGHFTNNTDITEIAFDLLAMGAPFLVPRLAFNVLSENMLFVSLREMMSNFILLTLLAVWSFAGFLLASSWMSRGAHSPWTIAKWMLWLWFGLDATGIEASPEFHWLLGPVLMISFAFLGNTLFLTILVSMLSNTFATIAANTEAEIQYRRTVIAFEGVKSDALFSYPPPFNILALAILLPMKLVLTPRYFHKVIVYSVRVINFPILIGLSFWERRRIWSLQLPSWWRNFSTRWQWDNLGLAVHGDLHTVFERAPPRSVYGSVDLGPHNDDHQLLQVPNAHHHPHLDHLGDSMRKDSMNIFFGGSRKESVGPYHEVTEQLHELFQEHGGGRENRERFEHIESSIVRMEEVFAKFCNRLASIERSGTVDDNNGGNDNSSGHDPNDPRRTSVALEYLAHRRGSADYGLRRDSEISTSFWRRESVDPSSRRESIDPNFRRESVTAAQRRESVDVSDMLRRESVDPASGVGERRGSADASNFSSAKRRSSRAPFSASSDIQEDEDSDNDNDNDDSAPYRRRSKVYGNDLDSMRRNSAIAAQSSEGNSRTELHRRRGRAEYGGEGLINLDPFRRGSQTYGLSTAPRSREREAGGVAGRGSSAGGAGYRYQHSVLDDDEEVCPIDTSVLKRRS